MELSSLWCIEATAHICLTRQWNRWSLIFIYKQTIKQQTLLFMLAKLELAAVEWNCLVCAGSPRLLKVAFHSLFNRELLATGQFERYSNTLSSFKTIITPFFNRLSCLLGVSSISLNTFAHIYHSRSRKNKPKFKKNYWNRSSDEENQESREWHKYAKLINAFNSPFKIVRSSDEITLVLPPKLFCRLPCHLQRPPWWVLGLS